jgi:hypothetical protein
MQLNLGYIVSETVNVFGSVPTELRCGHSWPIVPASGDSEDDCGEADGM